MSLVIADEQEVCFEASDPFRSVPRPLVAASAVGQKQPVEPGASCDREAQGQEVTRAELTRSFLMEVSRHLRAPQKAGCAAR